MIREYSASRNTEVESPPVFSMLRPTIYSSKKGSTAFITHYMRSDNRKKQDEGYFEYMGETYNVKIGYAVEQDRSLLVIKSIEFKDEEPVFKNNRVTPSITSSEDLWGPFLKSKVIRPFIKFASDNHLDIVIDVLPYTRKLIDKSGSQRAVPMMQRLIEKEIKSAKITNVNVSVRKGPDY